MTAATQHGSSQRFSLADRVQATLACPVCVAAFALVAGGLRCPQCGEVYAADKTGALDLLPRAAKTVRVAFTVPPATSQQAEPRVCPLKKNPAPEVNLDHVVPPRHLSRELLSFFPRPSRADAVALDLGCGDGIHRGVMEAAGFHYLGVDYGAKKAPVHADAHALPLQDASVDFVMSIATFEHLHNPFIAAREVRRVLRPGGVFLGTVAFLEPFHSRSYFHHSHLGIGRVLADAGFDVEHIGPSRTWSVLAAQAKNGLFPGMPPRLSRAMVWPVDAAHRLWWRALHTRRGDFGEEERLRKLAGAFRFVARAPASH